ncbi:hypothetical protein NPIL_618791 [Nephila pilipes]|uniref:Uncharacterized protein n=1 Tax=Nephila pilipes TaxID=299642 RepID=A0A8X6PG14_NEPPI|nr:hypothetical protein NPIL_618791 [Nephila pilipes]
MLRFTKTLLWLTTKDLKPPRKHQPLPAENTYHGNRLSIQSNLLHPLLFVIGTELHNGENFVLYPQHLTFCAKTCQITNFGAISPVDQEHLPPEEEKLTQTAWTKCKKTEFYWTRRRYVS